MDADQTRQNIDDVPGSDRIGSTRPRRSPDARVHSSTTIGFGCVKALDVDGLHLAAVLAPGLDRQLADLAPLGCVGNHRPFSFPQIVRIGFSADRIFLILFSVEKPIPGSHGYGESGQVSVLIWQPRKVESPENLRADARKNLLKIHS